MTKIKLLGALIFSLSLILAYYSKYTTTQNILHTKMLKVLNEQRAFTQEISKNIFYMYNHKDSSNEKLEHMIKHFVQNMNQREYLSETDNSKNIYKQKADIVKRWNKFYLLVQKFRDINKINNNAYTNIATEKLVDDIYKANIQLVVEFNKLIDMYKEKFEHFIYISKIIQITLFILLLILLIYTFTQLNEIINFIQNFLQTSKNIVKNSTVKGVKPIKSSTNLEEISKSANNFNFLVKKIQNSIEYSSKTLTHAAESLEDIENNIEDLLDLLDTMDTQNSYDKDIIKKEDILIEAVDELSYSIQKLQKLKANLINFKKTD
jgi:archaellum component FlaC